MTPLARALAQPLPPPGAQVWQIVALAITDTCACIQSAYGCEAAVARLAAAQDPAEARTLRARAALWATAAHAQDWDDYEPLGSTHPSAVLVAVLLAFGQRITMARAFAAYGAGFRTISTLGALLGYGHYAAGWHATGTLGALGAASCAAVCLGLTPAQHEQALCIAASRASGLKGQFGGPVKPLHAGFAAAAGIEAACLARAGVETDPDLLTADAGFLQVFGPPAEAWTGAPEQLRSLENNPLFAKPWPCCAYTHRAIEAALRMGPLPPGDIAAITLEIAAPYGAVAAERAPRTADAARFSVAFCVAAALIDGVFTPASVSQDACARPEVRQTEALVDIRPYPLPRGVGDMSPDAPDRLCVTLHSGRPLCEQVANPRGGPAKPLGRSDIVEKFRTSGGPVHLAETFLSLDPQAPFAAPL